MSIIFVDRNNQQIDMKLKIDTERLIDDFGGNTKLSKALAEIGVLVTPGAVHKWKARESLPTERIAALTLLSRKQGRDFTLDTYIKESNENLGS